MLAVARRITQRLNPGEYDPKACLKCASKQLDTLEVREGIARIKCSRCGLRQMAILKGGESMGRTEGWIGFPEKPK